MTPAEPPTDAHDEAPVSQIKRWIALIGATAIFIALLAAFGVMSLAIRETGDGSDPDRAFSPTENIPGALTAGLEWEPDADDLVRDMELTTREQLGSMWLRADDALARAGDGDLGGLEVWFVDAALAAALDRFAPISAPDLAPTRDVAPARGHRLQVDFYSLDGQVVVLSVETVRLRPIGAGAELVEVVERLEAMAVLSDGNWRIRHLERLTPRDDGIQIQS